MRAPTIVVESAQGSLGCGFHRSGTGGTTCELISMPYDDPYWDRKFAEVQKASRFNLVANPGKWRIYVPHYFALLIFSVCTVSPWICWSKRFSLRTLLIVMTLVAVGLGIIVWMTRAD
jgi:hypothetical protein